MFFHMLRLQLGDAIFKRGLQDFYQKKRFGFASFEDLRESFEAVSGVDLGTEFNQWITQSGAPEIRVSRARVETKGADYVVSVLIEQTQSGGAYHLRIPIAVTMKGQDRAHQADVTMRNKRLELSVSLPASPRRLDVDPEFDLFRRLDRNEIPPALTQTFGAREMLILVPGSTADGLLQAYRDLAESLTRSGPGETEIRLDTEIDELPDDRAVTILGWENRFYGEVVSLLAEYDVNIGKGGAAFEGAELPRKNHSLVFTIRHPKNRSLPLTWVASDMPGALKSLGQKLPHYHKYSYLGFEGEASVNVAKGRWPILDSPMTVFLPVSNATAPKVERGKLAPREPLSVLPPVFSKDRMLETMAFLSSDKLAGRGFGSEGLNGAAEFIAMRFQEAEGQHLPHLHPGREGKDR
jgi:hypothetical protein